MRIYLDTNLYGNYPPWCALARALGKYLFQRIRTRRYQLVTSALVALEVGRSPDEQVRILFDELAATAEWLEASPESDALTSAYITAEVVTINHLDDATHVALATVAGCDVITSWNNRQFSHKAAAYNRVNTEQGYGTIGFYTPDLLLQVHP
jgi:hypothetical protein